MRGAMVNDRVMRTVVVDDSGAKLLEGTRICSLGDSFLRFA